MVEKIRRKYSIPHDLLKVFFIACIISFKMERFSKIVNGAMRLTLMLIKLMLMLTYASVH